MATSGIEISNEDGFPSELHDRLSSFDNALSDIENVLHNAHSVPLNEIHTQILPIDKAKLDLLGGYTMNSLFWMYMSVTGENPKEHGIKQELDRVRSYMGRVKEIEDRAKAPKVDKDAAKRFIRSALWQQAHNTEDTPAKKDNESDSQQTDSISHQSQSTSSETNMDMNAKRKNEQHQPSASSDTPQSGGKKRKKSKKKNK